MASIAIKRFVLANLATAALSAGCMAQTPQKFETLPGSPTPTSFAPPYPGIVTDFETIAQTEGPAVVGINISGANLATDEKQLWPPPGFQESPFFRYFQQFSPSFADVANSGASVASSGIIVSTDGDILTSSGNIAGTSKISVTLADGRTYRATVTGDDPASGVALLNIAAKGLPVARIGSPSGLKAGQWVASIGSPYGLGNAIKSGIVSNTSRLLPEQSYIPLIQTDLIENSGDGGGPLLNLKGDVIGIETPLPAGAGTYQGLAFAIPIDEAMKVERQLKLHGKAEHGRMGITVQEVSGPLARSFGLTHPNGALVTSVDSHGPAAKAGLRAGDVVIALNGAAVPDATRLPATVADMRPGTAIGLAYWRNRAVHHATLVLSAMNAGDAPLGQTNDVSAGTYGLTVRNLTRDEKRAAGIQGGVRVEQSSGPAAFAGIEPGDIILKVDNASVSSAGQFLTRISRAGHDVALLVERHGARMFVTIDVS